ncbi:MAG TPA: terminase family protein, partial [Desulfobacterales bacterium]|nr:terminase family protein [Desulfobacterales bacterium]
MTISHNTAALAEKSAEEIAFSFFPSYIALQFPNYKFGKHHLLIAKHLMAVEAGIIKRLIILAPPRHGKTMLVSEFFPAWYLGRNPDHQIIALTYSFDRAGDVGRKVRNQLIEPQYSLVFPGCQISSDTKGANRLGTVQGGNYYSIGTSGGVTGRGAHVLLIDDPIKGKEDAESPNTKRKLESLFNTVAYTRLMPGGAIILVVT